MDSASIHRNDNVKLALKNNNIEAIYNVPYAFCYNPLERLWNQYKHSYRRLLLREMLKFPDVHN